MSTLKKSIYLCTHFGCQASRWAPHGVGEHFFSQSPICLSIYIVVHINNNLGLWFPKIFEYFYIGEVDGHNFLTFEKFILGMGL